MNWLYDRQHGFMTLIILLTPIFTPNTDMFYTHVADAQDHTSNDIITVCEGDTVDFSMPNKPFDALFVFKELPRRNLLLLEKHGDDKAIVVDDRLNYKNGNMLSISMENATTEDSGTYLIETLPLGDSRIVQRYVGLEVIEHKGCPNKTEFDNPSICLRMPDNEDGIVVRQFPNHSMTVETPAGELSLYVTLPRANPPVECVIAKGDQQKGCSGKNVDETTCSTKYPVGHIENEDITVTMSFSAYKSSLTYVHVHSQDIAADTGTLSWKGLSKTTTEEMSQSQISTGSWIAIGVGCFLGGTAFGMIFLALLIKATSKKGGSDENPRVIITSLLDQLRQPPKETEEMIGTSEL